MRRIGARRAVASLGAVLAVASACGSATSTSAVDTHTHARNAPPAQAPPTVARSVHSVTLHFDAGHQSASLTMPEPDGVILRYRISAPRGARVRGTTQLRSISAPLLIATTHTGPSSTCHANARRVTCTVGEEACPMPAGTWHVHLRKMGGPAGDVTIWFDVGQPPAKQAA